MEHSFFGDAIRPAVTAKRMPASTEKAYRLLDKFVLIDRFEVDANTGLITLGPLARAFHDLDGDRGSIGILTFLKSYHVAHRNLLADLFIQLSANHTAIHYTARLNTPEGAFVHGFIAKRDCGETGGNLWSGLLLLPRFHLTGEVRFDTPQSPLS